MGAEGRCCSNQNLCVLNTDIFLLADGFRRIMDRISSGSKVMDDLLEGGFEKDTISIIYGPGGSGKTNLCLLAAIDCAKNGKKVVYVDTEGGFSVTRLKQISSDDSILKNILILRPTTFDGQKKAFKKLDQLDAETIGIIIIDTIAMLYRLEIGKTKKTFSVNKELGNQIQYLSKIARKKNIPVILTNQVYSSMTGEDDVQMVGGELLKYQSKCLIELKKFTRGKRVAIIRKHRSIPEEKSVVFRLVEEGIIDAENA